MSPTLTPSLPQATSDSVGSCRTVEHELGKTEICGQPEKMEVLSPHILDIVLALGAQPAANRVFFVDYQLWGSITRGPITDELILEKLPEMLLPLLSN